MILPVVNFVKKITSALIIVRTLNSIGRHSRKNPHKNSSCFESFVIPAKAGIQ